MSLYGLRAREMVQGRREQRSLLDFNSGSFDAAPIPSLKETYQVEVIGNQAGGLADEETIEIVDIEFDLISGDGDAFLEQGSTSNGGTDIESRCKPASSGDITVVPQSNRHMLITTDGGDTWISAETNISGTADFSSLMNDGTNWIVTEGENPTKAWHTTTPETANSWTSLGSITSTTGVSVRDSVYDGTNWIWLLDSATKNVLVYATDPIVTKNFVSLVDEFENNSGDLIRLKAIAHDDGVWVLIGEERTAEEIVIFSTTDPTGAANWTRRQQLSATSGSGGVINLSTNGTTWAMTAFSSSSHRIYATTDPTTNSSWNLNSSFSNFSIIGDMYVVGSLWVLNDFTNVWTTSNPTGSWTNTVTSTNGVGLYHLGYDDTNWFVFGDNGTIYRTSDPSNANSYTIVTQFEFRDIYGSASSGELQISVGEQGGIYSAASDGTITRITSTGNFVHLDIATDGTTWIAVGAGSTFSGIGGAVISTDPTDSSSWSSLLNTGNGLTGIATDGTTWMMVTRGGEIRSTTTPAVGNSWVQRQDIGTLNNPKIFTDGTNWLISGDNGKSIFKSTNPTGTDSFTEITEVLDSRMVAAHWDGSLWVLITKNGTVYTSTDTSTWTERGNTFADITRVEENEGFWIATTDFGRVYSTTVPTSNSNWSIIETLNTGLYALTVTENGQWYAAGKDQAFVFFTLEDGLTAWELVLDSAHGQTNTLDFFTETSGGTSMATQFLAEILVEIAAGRITNMTATRTGTVVRLTSTSPGSRVDAEVFLRSGSNSTATVEETVIVQGGEITGLLTALTATAAGGNHSPSTVALSLADGSLIGSVQTAIRNIFANDGIGGFTVGEYIDDKFLLTSEISGAETPNLSIVITTAGTDGDIEINVVVIQEGRDLATLDITATIAGGGLTTDVTVGPSQEITAAQLKSALDTAVASDSAVSIADETAGHIMTTSIKKQYPTITLAVNNPYTDNMDEDIQTLTFGN